MERRQTGHILAVFAVALVLRATLFNYVGIWGDLGFYVYDSRLILSGQAPFVDFLGRSPLFNYFYAWTRAVFGHPVETLRWFIIAWWLLTGVPVYLIARRIRTHRAAVAALIVFLLTPFPLVYGMWANTQGLAAFFAACAICVLVYNDDYKHLTLAGALLGIAYLSRRSIIVVLGAVGLWILWDTGWIRRDVPRTVLRGATVTVAFFATITVGYAAVVGWGFQDTIELFRIHTMNLFFTYGRGGFPLLYTKAELVTNSVDKGRIPIFNDICQMCGSWTARTFAKTIVVTTGAVGVLFVYFRDITHHYMDTATKQYLFGILGALSLYAVVLAALAGYYVRVSVVVSLVLFAVVVYKSDRIPRSQIFGRELNLVLLVLAGLTIGYLYRNRVLHTYYFMDFWPMLGVVSGLLYERLWSDLDGRKVLQGLLVVAVLLAIVTSLNGAYPLQVVLNDNEDEWFTMNNIDDIHEDVNQRTEPGDVVFAASPSFIGGTHAKMPMDNPRLHMVAVRYKDTGPAVKLYETLIAGLRSGGYEYVIMSSTTRQMLTWNSTAKHEFKSNYCEVEFDNGSDPYDNVGATLFEYQPDCPAGREPQVPA